jgi:hypothetical protein
MNGERRPLMRRNARDGERGQILVIVAGGLAVLLVGVGLLIDGGAAFAGQRGTQNAADAAANAGALAFAERLGGATEPGLGWGAEVARRVEDSAQSNGITSYTATYADIRGVDLTVPVGGAIPGNAAGVRVRGARDVDTVFVRVIGLNTIPVGADATAVAGILSGAPSGGVLPVTFPVNISTCDPDGGADLVPGTNPWPIVGLDQTTSDNMAIVPLCTTGPGSIGWLDLGDGNLADQISNPSNRAFDVPTWLQTQTGTVDAMHEPLKAYIGKVVLIPLHDDTCKEQPLGVTVADCTAGPGVGDRTWYHIPKFAAFKIYGVYLKNDGGVKPRDACNEDPGEPFVISTSGSVACLKGWFVRYITTGPVIPGTLNPADPDSIGVQLIR